MLTNAYSDTQSSSARVAEEITIHTPTAQRTDGCAFDIAVKEVHNCTTSPHEKVADRRGQEGAWWDGRGRGICAGGGKRGEFPREPSLRHGRPTDRPAER